MWIVSGVCVISPGLYVISPGLSHCDWSLSHGAGVCLSVGVPITTCCVRIPMSAVQLRVGRSCWRVLLPPGATVTSRVGRCGCGALAVHVVVPVGVGVWCTDGVGGAARMLDCTGRATPRALTILAPRSCVARRVRVGGAARGCLAMARNAGGVGAERVRSCVRSFVDEDRGCA